MVCVCVGVCLVQFGALVQTGAGLGLVYTAYNAHLLAMPYEADELDRLEAVSGAGCVCVYAACVVGALQTFVTLVSQYSLLTTLITFYCGIFLNAERIDDFAKITLVVFIFVAQVWFQWSCYPVVKQMLTRFCCAPFLC